MTTLSSKSSNHDRAQGYIRRIQASCERLKTFPEVGRLRDDLRLGVRILGFERRVVIVYMVLSSGDVEIGRSRASHGQARNFLRAGRTETAP